MRRFFRFFFLGFLLAATIDYSSVVFSATDPHPGGSPYASQGAASEECAYFVAVHVASDPHDTWTCGFTARLPSGSVAQCSGGPDAGGYSLLENGHFFSGTYDWCAPVSCSGDSFSAYRPQNDATAPLSDGNSCCVTWVSENSGDSPLYCWSGYGCWEKGHYHRTGSRCVNDFDWRDPSHHQKRDDQVCDHGQVGGSCYDPHKDAFCGTTEYGESVCVPRKTPDPGGCISGATGSICVGKDGNPPPKPSDPPIPSGKPPDGTSSGSVTDGGGNTSNYTTNNYSGTSTGGSGTGDGSGSGSPPSSSGDGTWSGSDGGSTGGQSNANGSGNSGPASGSSGGGSGDGKCSDGSVPTASGCSGTYTDNGCDTPPQCFGDAVLCGQARELHALRCTEQKDKGPASSSSSGDNDDDLFPDLPDADPFDTSGDLKSSAIIEDNDGPSADDLDAGGFGFSVTCPLHDISFSLMGRDVVIPLADKCAVLEWVRWLVLALGYFVGAKIIAGLKS
jgi:hypothetical protein